jgi:DNA primase
MSNITEDIKSRLDVVDIIKEYIQLTPAGVNFKALCPFHNEKTPSFVVSPEKQIWHCFGCGAGGDIFEFVKKIEGLEFPEALRILADKANVKIDYNYSPELKNQKTKALDILEVTTNYYYQLLLKDKEAKIARDYLEERVIKKEAIEKFHLGYSKDSWDDLVFYLRSKKFIDADIEASGLAIRSKKDNKLYDRFRGRLMFPINNIFGQTIGFTARVLKKDDQQGKYVNTPQSIIFDKSSVLYNMDLAKIAIKQKNYTILAEGQIDVISSYMAGVENIIASSGTALTPQQVKIIKRYSDNLMIAYDADKAGLKATFRIVDNALVENINIKIIEMPKGMDPDQLIKKDKKKWLDAIKKAKPIMDFVFDKVMSIGDMNDVFQKKQMAQKLLVFISKFQDDIERETYLKRLSDSMDVDYDLLKEKLDGFLNKNKKNYIVEEEKNNGEYQPSRLNKKEELLKKIIALGISFLNNLEYLSSNLELEYIDKSIIDELYKEIIIYYTKNNSFDLKVFEKALDKEKSDLLNIIILIFENEYSDYDQNTSFVDIQALVKSYKKEFLNKELKRLENSLKLMEKKGNQKEIEKITKEFVSVTHKLNNIS